MFSPMLNDWTSTRTYATRANLEKKLVEYRLSDVVGALIIRTPEGRWTAVFGKSFLDAADIPFMGVANLGFKVLG